MTKCSICSKRCPILYATHFRDAHNCYGVEYVNSELDILSGFTLFFRSTQTKTTKTTEKREQKEKKLSKHNYSKFDGSCSDCVKMEATRIRHNNLKKKSSKNGITKKHWCKKIFSIGVCAANISSIRTSEITMNILNRIKCNFQLLFFYWVNFFSKNGVLYRFMNDKKKLRNWQIIEFNL